MYGLMAGHTHTTVLRPEFLHEMSAFVAWGTMAAVYLSCLVLSVKD